MNTLDRVIGFFAPGWAVNRVQARATLTQIQGVLGATGGYAAGKQNRLNGRSFRSTEKENDIPKNQLDNMRAWAWQLYRDNPYARKIVRSLEAKVVGSGMSPESQASALDGQPAVAFRNRAKELWDSIQGNFDFRGRPGQGGLTFPALQRLALRTTVLSGETLYRLVPLTSAESLERGSPIPMCLQLIDAGRLADDFTMNGGSIPEGHSLFRGIELDSDGKRVRYYIRTFVAGTSIQTEITPINANEVGHLYIEEDIDQLRGATWFASTLSQLRDAGDVQYNVVTSTKMAACVVLGYRKPTGATKFGLNQSTEAHSSSSDGTDLTDADGNAITKIQPGMFVNLGRDGELTGWSPPQLNMNVEGFIQHMLRGVASGLPGIKASTVTGDYRNSSFSSERSADNDVWPEVLALQEWFSASFCQPVYEAVIRAGILSGFFDGIIDANEFSADPNRYLAARWQGPVAQSINPTDDITSQSLRMKHLMSSPQAESAKSGANWRQTLADIAAFYETARELNVPEEVINNSLGVDMADVIAQQQAANQEGSSFVQA